VKVQTLVTLEAIRFHCDWYEASAATHLGYTV